MNRTKIVTYSELKDRRPTPALVAGVDLVIVQCDQSVSVLYGLCAHRGALMADGYVDANNLVCGVHYWDYRIDSGVSEYSNTEHLDRFSSWIEDDAVWVDEDDSGSPFQITTEGNQDNEEGRRRAHLFGAALISFFGTKSGRRN
jgi:nitrite reductase/ring-hydroxylating ferredoxin subunit